MEKKKDFTGLFSDFLRTYECIRITVLVVLLRCADGQDRCRLKQLPVWWKTGAGQCSDAVRTLRVVFRECGYSLGKDWGRAQVEVEERVLIDSVHGMPPARLQFRQELKQERV